MTMRFTGVTVQDWTAPQGFTAFVWYGTTMWVAAQPEEPSGQIKKEEKR